MSSPVLSEVKTLAGFNNDPASGRFSGAGFIDDGASGACRFFRAMLWPYNTMVTKNKNGK